MTKEKAIEKLIAFFEDDCEAFADAMEALDSWNGYLEDDRRWPMDSLGDWMSGLDWEDVFNYGRNGEDVYGGSFNGNRDYFYIDGYGNLVSTDDRDYDLDRWAVEALIDNESHIDLPTEVQNIIDSIGEEDEDEKSLRECGAC